MKDDYDEYYESKEANQDSKSDAKVVLFLIIAPFAASFGVRTSLD